MIPAPLTPPSISITTVNHGDFVHHDGRYWTAQAGRWVPCIERQERMARDMVNHIYGRDTAWDELLVRAQDRDECKATVIRYLTLADVAFRAERKSTW